MKNILRNAAANTQTVFYAAYSPFRGGNGALGLAFLPAVLGVTATAFVGFVATETGAVILGELREIYGTPHHLDLWVKVEPNWTRNYWMLKKFGYV